MLKKNFLLFIFLIFGLFLYAEDFHYIAEKDVAVFFRDEDLILSLNNKKIIRKGTAVNLDCEKSRIRLTNKNKQNKLLSLVYDSNIYKGFISIKNLKIKDCNEVLPESIISVEEIGISKKYVPAYMLKVLYKKNRDLLIENDTRYKKYHKINPEIWKNKFEEALLLALQSQYYYATISNIGIRLHSNDNFIFKHITEISKTEYECKGIGIAEWNPYQENMNYWQTYFENTSETAEKEEILRLIVDGDYLTVFNKTRNKEIIGLVLISDTIEEQLINLFKDASCDLSRVTWPRHADGTCDYETEVRLQSGKRYRSSDNLRLRASGSTAGKPVVTIGKGTQVKVLSIGTEQTIDSITSNWVQVEVQAGAKDRDGKPIAAGTVGWCFGGYLGE